jgi:hypothetical protein
MNIRPFNPSEEQIDDNWRPTEEQIDEFIKIEKQLMLTGNEQEHQKVLEKHTLPEVRCLLNGLGAMSCLINKELLSDWSCRDFKGTMDQREAIFRDCVELRKRGYLFRYHFVFWFVSCFIPFLKLRKS